MNQFFDQLICPKTHTKLVLSADGKTLNNTSSEKPVSYDVNEIVDLVFPRELFEQDRKEQVAITMHTLDMTVEFRGFLNHFTPTKQLLVNK